MKLRVWFCILLCSGCVQAVAAEVRAFVDRSVITENETLLLNIEASEEDGEPDVQPLSTDFEVLSNARSSRVSIVNGRVDTKKEWRMELSPRRLGDLEIPSLVLGNKRTAAINVKVVAAGKSAANGKKDDSAAAASSEVFLETSVDKRSVDVQAQLIYTLRLFHAVDLKEGTLALPDLGEAIVERLGDDVASDTVRDGRRYRVVERKYAIFPQVSGSFKIPPAEFKGRAVGRGSSGFSNLFNRRLGADPFDQLFNSGEAVRVRAKEWTIDVTPQPKGAHGTHSAWWLPAQQFKLSETWLPDPPQFRVGEPVTRSVVMEVEGLTAQQLPELVLADVSGLKLYPDQPIKESTSTATGMSAKKIQKVALVATQTGKLRLPAMEISWWDTRQRKLQVATLPARTIDVLPALGSASSTPLTQLPPVAAPIATLNTPMNGSAEVDGVPAQRTANFWPYITTMVIAAWLMTLLAWWLDRNGRREAQYRLMSRTDAHVAERVTSLKSARAAVRAAGAGNDAKAMRDAVLQWAAVMWPDAPRSFAALAARCDDNAAREALLLLDQQMYAGKTEGSDEILTEEIKAAVAAAIAHWVDTLPLPAPAKQPPGVLRALYPG